MKTCSMCGTLLFDDADKCTKCGLVLSEQGPSQGPPPEQDTAPVDNPQVSAEPEAPVSDAPPATPDAPSEPVPAEPETTEPEPAPEAGSEGETNAPATEGESPEPNTGDDGPAGETSVKRQKWLDEQDKIKAELANILGRVGKKKKPVYTQVVSGPGMIPTQVPMPTQAVAPGMAPTQVQVNPQIPTQAPTQVNPNIPSNVGTQQPTQVANPPQMNPPASAPPNPGSAPVPAPTQGPTQAPAAPAPALEPTTTTAPVPTAGGPTPGSEGGLSEVDKKELMNELNDLRNEGYNVSKLERIIRENPGIAWKAFSDFLDDIEKLNQQKARVEQINTDGLSGFDIEKSNLLSQMNDPDLLTNYESQITQFENKLLAAKSDALQQGAAEPNQTKKIEQSKKLIGLAKEAFREKQYDRALDLFTKAGERDPTNKEIGFFLKKVEAKLSEGSVEASVEAPEPAPTSVPVGPAAFEEPYSEPSEEVVVAKKKKKKRKKVVAKGAPAPAEVPGVVQQEAQQPAQANMDVPGSDQVAPDPAQPDGESPAAGGPPGVADGPRTAAEFEALGFNAYINKDYPKALEFYQKVLEIDANFPNVQNIINECQLRLGKK